jgi:ketosteroid isomerase-like protein
MTNDELAEAVRAWCHAYDTHDIDTIVQMEASSVGFGFRTVAPRSGGRIGRELAERFFSGVDYYRVTLESLETDVNAGVGLAWGVFIEDFQHKGEPPERARVRFSNAMTKVGTGWQILLYHRDIQPFDEEGRYPKTLTAISRSH